MTGHKIRKLFLDFMKTKGHTIIPSASLVPENDPTVLFTTAGMHPLVPYLLGEPHPQGSRLADAQKCLRTDDITEVGDERHLTFFEMLGNWSLGDYFKTEAISWSFEFLTGKKWLGLDPSRLYVTVFAGDKDAPFDAESVGIWKEQFKKVGLDAELSRELDIGTGARVFAYDKKKNWWGPAGASGPCGPDTEMFYTTGKKHDVAFGKKCHPNCDCGAYVEIWNDVFMQYFKTPDGHFLPMERRNVDTGMGLERITAVTEGVNTVFETSLFKPIIKKIEAITGRAYTESEEARRGMRIIADHLRAATFVLGDNWGVSPSNKDQGYIVRRLIRRAVSQAWLLDKFTMFAPEVAEVVIEEYGDNYPELRVNRDRILIELRTEEEKFRKTLEHGIKMISDFVESGSRVLTGSKAFELYATYGFPIELTREILSVKSANLAKIDEEGFKKEFEEHQKISRAGSTQKFAGGLADHSAESTRLHTATHLLHKALRNVLGEHVEQKGSNITRERLRFDFSHPAKMTPTEIKEVEQMVNEQIKKNLPVHFEVLEMNEAKKLGALGFFEDKYAKLGGKIKVYMVGNSKEGYFSCEICGGPHVEATSELGGFKILKEEAVSAGVRRIKAAVAGPKSE